MKNLGALSRDVLIGIVLELDSELDYIQQQANPYEVEDLKIRLNKAYRDYEEMNLTRKYWKNMALDYKKQLIEAGLIERRQRKQVSTHNETIEEPIETKKFKITIIKDGKKIDIDDLPKKKYKSKETYKHAISSGAGNISGTKHSGHMKKEDTLIGVFPNGDVIEFYMVNEAKDYIRNNFEEYKESPLTNISRAARRSGFYANNGGVAYGIEWSYGRKGEEYTVDGVQIERGE